MGGPVRDMLQPVCQTLKAASRQVSRFAPLVVVHVALLVVCFEFVVDFQVPSRPGWFVGAIGLQSKRPAPRSVL